MATWIEFSGIAQHLSPSSLSTHYLSQMEEQRNKASWRPFKENFIWVVLTKIVAIWKSLIEISSCLVKHTEVTQKYISELTELKKSKDYMQPEQNTFLHFLPIFRLGWNPSALPHCAHGNSSGNAEMFCLETRHTSQYLQRNFYRYNNQKLPSRNKTLQSSYSYQLFSIKQAE